MTPVRIQRKRTKDWRMPEGAVYVGRPTVWGNPFKTAEQYRRAWCGSVGHDVLVAYFRLHKWEGPIDWTVPSGWLRGKNLACWCPLDQPCHADVLLELANTEAKK